MAAQPVSGTETATQPSGATPLDIGSVVMQVLAAVAAGIGVLGFVVFVGGAITWARFEHLGLSRAEAVSRVPQEVLVVTGASVLAPAALLALAAVLVLYLYDRALVHIFDGPLRRRRSELAKLDHRRDVVFRDAQRQRRAAEESAARRDGAAARLAELTERVKAGVDPDELSDEIRSVQEAQREAAEDAERLGTLAAERTKSAGMLAEQAQALETEIRRSSMRARREDALRIVLGASVLLLVIFLAVVLPRDGLSPFETLITIGAGVAASMLALQLWATTRRFLWFGATAFIAIGLVFALGEYFESGGTAGVTPAAILAKDRSPVTGFLVAETKTHLYVGQIEPPATGVRFLALARDDVTELALGPETAEASGRSKAIALALELCRQRHRDPAPRKTKGGKKIRPQAQRLCSPREIAALKDQQVG